MQCTHCLALLAPQRKFCSTCGTPVIAPVPPSAPRGAISFPTFPTCPMTFTTESRDFWTLGALGLLVLSFFLPMIAGPYISSSTAPINTGTMAWIGLLGLLAVITATALPRFRPVKWLMINRWLSAAAVGCVVTVAFIISSLTGVADNFVGQGSNSPFTMGMGWMSALLGSVVWTAIVWRTSPMTTRSRPGTFLHQHRLIPTLSTTPTPKSSETPSDQPPME